MEKITRYQLILRGFLEEYATIKFANAPNLEQQVIIDCEGNHFQLISLGWQDAKYYCDPIFHFDIKNEKVWIQQNETEMQIGDELVQRGIAKEDIVFGFLPEYARNFVQFAA